MLSSGTSNTWITKLDLGDFIHHLTFVFCTHSACNMENLPTVHHKDILLDTGSNCSIFNCRSMLQGVHCSKTKLCILTNSSYQDSHLVGNLPGFFQVWYNKESHLNILSFADNQWFVSMWIMVKCFSLKKSRKDYTFYALNLINKPLLTILNLTYPQ